MTIQLEQPVPLTGPIRLIRSGLIQDDKLKLVQHGDSSFRLHTDEISVTLHPEDALWLIAQLSLVPTLSPIMKRIVVWTPVQSSDSIPEYP